MSGTQTWQAALAAFERWQDAADPAALLAEIETEDPALAARVRGLIEADRQAEAGNFLAQPVQAEALGQELAGQRLGAWTLQSLLGRGGMGEVWRARRSDGAHSGEAAIKLLHSPGRGDAAAARFRREGELLARLRHPHIAQLLDIGEAQLGPWALRYLVIELVDGGERLDAYATARQLGTAERLALMQQVCSAVAHAHAQLIVHRDLKPGNVLVTPDGQVKLLDFGVAKLLDNTEGSDELTRLAAAGLTPEYAAPEQLHGEPVSVATDVYALGVMLCQLLTGQRQLPGAKGLDADLRALISRATQPRPEDRYASVAALSEDLRRYQDHEPLFARAGPWRYRAGKFLRRHRVGVAAGSVVTLSLLAGLAGTWWQWREAAQEAERTRRVQTVMTELLGAFSPEVANRSDVPMVELLRRAWAEAKKRLADDPALLADVAKPLGLLLSRAGDMGLAAEALEVAAARPGAIADTGLTLELAHAWRRQNMTDRARPLLEALTNSADTTGRVVGMSYMGELALEEGDLAAAESWLKQAAASALQLGGRAHPGYRRACDDLLDLARQRGDWEGARHWASEQIQASHGHARSLAQARVSYGVLLMDLGELKNAVAELDAGVASLTEVLGRKDAITVYARTWLANALARSGRHSEAMEAATAAVQDARAVSEPLGLPSVSLTLQRWRLRGDAALQARAELPALADELGRLGHPAGRARAQVLLAEALLRLDAPATEPQALLAAAWTWQSPNLPQVDSERWLTLALYALTHLLSQQPVEAQAKMQDAESAVLAATPELHPDRLRVAALRNWLHARVSGDSEGWFIARDRYLQALNWRSDAASLRKRILGLPDPARHASIAAPLLLLST
ncbi:protein kinase domain-containing protein [Roseateles sp.]|uniref:serine/threonine-protein kinase n=1 Tax=Roseateles sp. TaxID=1971397 RepID=UPI003923EEF6